MTRLYRSGWLAVALITLLIPASALADIGLKMQVGEVRVLAIPDVARVAVGDGHILNAVTTDEKEVIVFARNEGSSAMQVWSSNGKSRRYQVDVAAEGTRQTQQELRTVLERIAGARVSTVGDKLLVEGENLSDSDRQRVLELAKRYPQLLDFTSQIGWDRMVLLDVQVIEVPRARLQELGVRWNPTSSGGINAGLSWDGGSTRLSERPGESVLNLPFPATVAAGYFGVNALLSARINAMAQSGSAVVLAQPQLLARSGATAEFLAGGEVPYSTVDANGNTNTAFKPYGVSLRITPRVESNGAVRSHIEVEVSSVDTALSVPNGPSLKTRRAATEFNVHSGQTLVLAGFLSREASRNVDKIPTLGDLPILGQLFRTTKSAQHDTELAIFVTPVVVGADHPGMQTRIEKGLALLDESFGQEAVINVPIRPEPTLPPAMSVGMDDVTTVGWNPWESSGSQWQTVATPAQSLPHMPLVPPTAGVAVNQYAFTE
ncbi:MAG: pilus assembly protein N-terminal domain-containing protein [Burkholderiaceae bacterium]|nr:pilus assembly protein N-terminal domain-containing protein [Burkholderiaceae bacterium]